MLFYLCIFMVSYLSLGAYPQRQALSDVRIPYLPTYEGKTRIEVIKGAQGFKKRVLEADIPIIAHFDICGGPYAEKLKRQCREATDVLKKQGYTIRTVFLDVRKNKGVIEMIGSRLGITSFELPLIIFFHEGKIVLPIFSGYMNKERLVQECKNRIVVHRQT